MMVGDGVFLEAYWKTAWLFVTPAVLVGISTLSILVVGPPSYGSYTFPTVPYGVGWAMALGSSIMIPLFFVITVS